MLGLIGGVDDFQVEGLIYQTSVPMCLLGPANSGSRVLTPHLRVRVLYAGVLIDGITVAVDCRRIIRGEPSKNVRD